MSYKVRAVRTARPTACVALFRMNSEQFIELPDSEQKLELLDGEVIMSPPPRPAHQVFLYRLFAALDEWIKPRQLGRLYPDTAVRLGDDWTPTPDLAFLKTEHLDRVQEVRIVGPVDLAAEILSPSNADNDLEVKFAAYARHGIPWYWIVDLDGNRLTEYELVGAAYANPVEVPFGTPFTPRLFPGLTIDLGALLR
jgi:Uma2 family endonuclease